MDLALDESIFDVETAYYSCEFVEFTWTDGYVAENSTSCERAFRTIWQNAGGGGAVDAVFRRERGWSLLEWVDNRGIILRKG
jgi:hypothetical protein